MRKIGVYKEYMRILSDFSTQSWASVAVFKQLLREDGASRTQINASLNQTPNIQRKLKPNTQVMGFDLHQHIDND